MCNLLIADCRYSICRRRWAGPFGGEALSERPFIPINCSLLLEPERGENDDVIDPAVPEGTWAQTSAVSPLIRTYIQGIRERKVVLF